MTEDKTEPGMARSFSIKEFNSQTGEAKIISVYVPADLSLTDWEMLEKWVQSIKPKEE